MRKETAKINFTKKVLDALPVPKDKRAIYYDKQTRGLGLLVQPTGRRSFFWFRKINGNAEWKTIGEFPDLSIENGREKAGQFNTALAKWKSDGYEGPSPFKQRSGVTFGDVFNSYYNLYRKQTAKNQDRLPEEEKRFNRHLKPWTNRKMDSLRRDEFVDLHNQISIDNGRTTANRTIELGRRMVNWAIRDKGAKGGGGEMWRGENPFKFALNKSKSRDRFAQPDELKRLFKALASENPDVRDIILLALYTGQRRGNIAAMRWNELSVTADRERLWRIPDPKNREPQVVPLMPEAVRVLAARMKKRGDNEFVFPSRSKSGHIRDVKRGWKRLKKEAKLENLTVHDLRRTLGSVMATSGVSLPVIGKVLGHKSMRSTEIYARLQTSAARDAMTLAVAKFPKMGKLPKLLEAHNG